MIHAKLAELTNSIRGKSSASRASYLRRMERAAKSFPARAGLGCSNLAHGFAACSLRDKNLLSGEQSANLAIVTAYNDMLSAHQPLAEYPHILKAAVAALGASAQVAGGVPAMCDGVTQGYPGMELSLLSRDTIAMSTVVALSHAMYDGVFCLGVCDKIVPGLVIGALAFGHLPAIFVPAGPMPSGLPNEEKSRIRQLYVQGKVERAALLQAESASYHAPGTCTFYGTANTNQMIMEVMGLHVAGGTFVNPGTPLRQALTEEAGRRLVRMVNSQAPGIGWQLDERAFTNALVGIAATGGSTNLAIHLIAMARAAGIQLDWADFQAASDITPLLTRVYPNGRADVNHFQAAGGLGFLIRQLLEAGLLHRDIPTAMGGGLEEYAVEAGLGAQGLQWHPAPLASRNEDVLRPQARPFQATGGLKLLRGNLGRAILKTSAMPENRLLIQAPARVFSTQEAFNQAYARGALQGDWVVVVRFQGPRANGMPELHKLTPALASLQEQGFQVALLTDGRMSGASGSVPAAIHLVPEAAQGGPLARVRDGDLIRLDVLRGSLDVLVDEGEWAARQPATEEDADAWGHGREYFAPFRRWISSAEEGASMLLMEDRS